MSKRELIVSEIEQIPAAGFLACRSFLAKAALPTRSVKPFQSMNLTQFQAKPHFQSSVSTHF
jgi:hypothetical protein